MLEFQVTKNIKFMFQVYAATLQSGLFLNVFPFYYVLSFSVFRLFEINWPQSSQRWEGWWVSGSDASMDQSMKIFPLPLHIIPLFEL